MTVVPNPAFLDGETPTITLAKRAWPIPLLTPKQQKHVLPALFELIPVLVAIKGAASDRLVQVMRTLDTSHYDLIITAVYWGLKKAHPELTREEFEDMPCSPFELIAALKIVSDQTGLIRERDPALPEGDETLGEAVAAGSA